MNVALDQNLVLLEQGADLLQRIDDSIYRAAGREFGVAPSTLLHWDREETVRA